MVPLPQSFSSFPVCEWEQMWTINHIFTKAVISGLEVNKDSQTQSKILHHFHWTCCNLLGRMICDQCPPATQGNSE